MLLSVTARVFTGASEAQVNFTSLIVDQHPTTQTAVHEHNLLHHSVLKSAEGASSLPDKHRTYSTYKKYTTPDKSISIDIYQTKRKAGRASPVQFVSLNRIHSSINLPVANSPPAVVSALVHTNTTTSGSPVVTENNFGEIAIDYSAREFSGIKF